MMEKKRSIVITVSVKTDNSLEKVERKPGKVDLRIIPILPNKP